MLKTKQLENWEYVLIIDGIAEFGLESHESLCMYLHASYILLGYSVLSEKNS